MTSARILSAAALAAGLTLLGATPAPPDPYLRILTLERARSLGEGQLAGYLTSPDEQVAARAALAVGRTKQKDGAALLAPHLTDKRDAVRAMSVYGLGLIAMGSNSDAILSAAKDPSSAVRAAALDAIGRYQVAGVFSADDSARAASVVAAALLHDEDPLVRERAASTLGTFGTTPSGAMAANALVNSAQHETDVRVRRSVMWTIFRSYAIRVPRAVLTKGLHDDDEVVRIEAARAYGRLKNADAIPALEPLAQNDPSWRVAETAMESIRVLKGQAQSDHWTAIPPNVHLPAIAADPLDALQTEPRPSPVAGKPAAPTPEQAALEPKIDPRTAADMSGPAHGAHPRVRIVTTKGNVYVTLYPEWAPLTVANFLNLAERGYYDNNRWFRIVPDFVVQTGDPNDNGEGDAGYSIGAEENPLEQQSYVISMGMNYDGNKPLRDSAGTQYYVTLSPQLHLNRDFTVYGEVSGGDDVLAHLIESDRVVRVERIPDVTL